MTLREAYSPVMTFREAYIPLLYTPREAYIPLLYTLGRRYTRKDTLGRRYTLVYVPPYHPGIYAPLYHPGYTSPVPPWAAVHLPGTPLKSPTGANPSSCRTNS